MYIAYGSSWIDIVGLSPDIDHSHACMWTHTRAITGRRIHIHVGVRLLVYYPLVLHECYRGIHAATTTFSSETMHGNNHAARSHAATYRGPRPTKCVGGSAPSRANDMASSHVSFLLFFPFATTYSRTPQASIPNRYSCTLFETISSVSIRQCSVLEEHRGGVAVGIPFESPTLAVIHICY
jgi:hypothetical protein